MRVACLIFTVHLHILPLLSYILTPVYEAGQLGHVMARGFRGLRCCLPAHTYRCVGGWVGGRVSDWEREKGDSELSVRPTERVGD